MYQLIVLWYVSLIVIVCLELVLFELRNVTQLKTFYHKGGHTHLSSVCVMFANTVNDNNILREQTQAPGTEKYLLYGSVSLEWS